MALLFAPDFTDLDTIAADDGTAANFVEGVNYGIAGHGASPGVYIGGTATLDYPTSAAKFNFLKGTISFWLKPNWDGRVDQLGVNIGFFRIVWGATQTLLGQCYLYTAPSNRIQNTFFPQFNHSGGYTRRIQSSEPHSMMTFLPGVWNKVELFWNFTLGDGSCYVVLKMNNHYSSILTLNSVILEDLAGGAKIYMGQCVTPKVNGVISDFKIYDTSLLATIPFPEYAFTTADIAGTYANMAALFSADGIANNWETNATEPGDCPILDAGINPGVNVMFFQRPAFEPVYSNCVPVAAEIGTSFPVAGAAYKYQSPPGEYEPLFFNVYSRIALTGVTVNYTAFSGAGTINKADCQLRIVRPWWQAAKGGGTVFQKVPDFVPGLLVCDDSYAPEEDLTLKNAVIPNIPVSDQCTTSMGAYTTKQFVLIVKIPSDAPAGVYTCTITLDANEITAQILILKLTVLPFSLHGSGRKFSVALGSYGSDYPNFAVQNSLNLTNLVTANLTDIRNHKLNCVHMGSHQEWGASPIDGYSFTQLQEAKIAAAASAGFEMVIFDCAKESSPPSVNDQSEITIIKGLLDSYGLPSLFYAMDEVSTTHLYANQLALAPYVEAAGGQFIATSDRATNVSLTTDGHPLYGIFHGLGASVGNDTAYRVQRGADTPMDGLGYEGVYWQLRGYRENRYYFGYFLWVTGFNFTGAWSGYRSGSGVSHEQYYNDFYDDAANRRYRPYVLSYPALDGAAWSPVSTFHWEIVREGIKDVEYLATWKYYYDRTKIAHPTEAAASKVTIDNLVEKYQDNYQTIAPAPWRVTQTEYATDRAAIITEILSLKTIRGSEVLAGGVLIGKASGVVAGKICGVVTQKD